MVLPFSGMPWQPASSLLVGGVTDIAVLLHRMHVTQRVDVLGGAILASSLGFDILTAESSRWNALLFVSENHYFWTNPCGCNYDLRPEALLWRQNCFWFNGHVLQEILWRLESWDMGKEHSGDIFIRKESCNLPSLYYLHFSIYKPLECETVSGEIFT